MRILWKIILIISLILYPIFKTACYTSRNLGIFEIYELILDEDNVNYCNQDNNDWRKI